METGYYCFDSHPISEWTQSIYLFVPPFLSLYLQADFKFVTGKHVNGLTWDQHLGVSLQFEYVVLTSHSARTMVSRFTKLLMCVLQLGVSFGIFPGDVWTSLEAQDFKWNVDSLAFSSTSESYQSPSAAPRAHVGWRGFIGCVCVCVWLLTPTEGQKHPRVKRAM